MTKIVRTRTAGRTVGLTSSATSSAASPSSVRLSISGKTILDHTSTPIVLRGINWGTWNENLSTDGALAKAQGANCMRYVFRWYGKYGDSVTDSRDDEAYAFINARNFTQFLREVQWATSQGIWVIVAFDSNCGQNGLQDAEMITYCGSTGPYASQGHNFLSDPDLFGLYRQGWKAIARALLSIPYIAAFELTPEMLEGRDSSFAQPLRDYYTTLINDIRTIDKRTPFLIGPRDAYNIVLSDEAYLSGRTDVIYTGNILSGKTTNATLLPSYVKALADMRDARNVPVLVQQVGRNTSDDASLVHMNNVLSILNAYGISWTWWQNRQNTTNPGAYALYYKDGVGGWTPKTSEIALISYYYAQTYAALESAAQAAATAAGGSLYYVKSDFSNVKQDSAGTIPVTAVGQPIGQITPVVGSAGAIGNATGTACPVLGQITATGRYAMVFDGADDYLQFSSLYWTSSADNIAVIASGIPAETATNRVFLHCGTGAAIVRFPYVGVNATDVGTASWRDDAGVSLYQIDGALVLSDRPVVMSATKQVNDKKLFVNGVQEGATESTALGTVTPTRIRVGSASTTTGYFQGPIACLFVGKTITDQQRKDIERFAAFLAGAAFGG